ncbi:hypothetical protein F9C11_20415 [Amycolatopsis sp. VS8301801F10]|uniref:hypothetical protein n=1 Tax=unclassified Amycolatopsis TaxID=2618356 RepID=UPI0038FCB585
MTDIVDLIDEVTTPVCGWCSVPLSSDGASLDFCTEDCHTRWHAERSERLVGSGECGYGVFLDASVVWRDPVMPTDRLRAQVIDSLSEPVPVRTSAEIIYDFNVDLHPFREALERNLAQMSRAFDIPLPVLMSGAQPNEIEDAAEDARLGQILLNEPSLADRMQAALEARRHRNTGPRQQPRAPKRIDARRTR